MVIAMLDIQKALWRKLAHLIEERLPIPCIKFEYEFVCTKESGLCRISLKYQTTGEVGKMEAIMPIKSAMPKGKYISLDGVKEYSDKDIFITIISDGIVVKKLGAKKGIMLTDFLGLVKRLLAEYEGENEDGGNEEKED